MLAFNIPMLAFNIPMLAFNIQDSIDLKHFNNPILNYTIGTIRYPYGSL